MKSVMDRVCGFLEDPIVARRLGYAAGWGAFAAMALVPEVAFAAFPIARLQTMVTDLNDHQTGEGALIGCGLGVARAGFRMATTGFEQGLGHGVQGAAGGAVLGATPEVASYCIG